MDAKHSSAHDPYKEIASPPCSHGDIEAATDRIGIKESHHKLIPRLDALPQELLVHILAIVPYSPETCVQLSLVCRRLYELVAFNSTDEPNVLGRKVIERQYGLMNVVMRLEPTWDNVNRLKTLERRILNVVSVAKAVLTLRDLVLEAEDWEEDLFYCLLLFLSADKFGSSDKRHWIYRLSESLHEQAVLGMRYICLKLGHCIFVTMDKIQMLPQESREGRIYNSRNHNTAIYAGMLESILIGGRFPEPNAMDFVCNIMDAAAGRYQRIRHELMSTYSSAFLDTLVGTISLSQRTKAANQAGTYDFGGLSTLFELGDNGEAAGVGRCPAGHTMLIVRRMLEQENLTFPEFVHKYRWIGWEGMPQVLDASNEQYIYSTSARFGTFIFRDIRPNRFLFEPIILAKLLNGSSELRKSFKPTASFLREVVWYRDSGKDITDD